MEERPIKVRDEEQIKKLDYYDIEEYDEHMFKFFKWATKED